MTTRKQFLKGISGAAGVVALSPFLSLLESCAPSVQVVRATLRENRVAIPADGLPDLSQDHVFARVYVDGIAKPFYLFQLDEGEYTAVYSSCSHRGCEVNKSRKGFECPCHGSEYDLNGNVVRGPAPEPLERYHVMKSAVEFSFQLSPNP